MEVFSSLIWFEPLFKGSKLNKLNRELALEAYQFREMDHQGRRWSKKNYPGGYTSYGSITNVHQISSTFAELEKRIRQHVLDYARALHWEVNPDDLRVDSLWINIMPPQVIHTGHIHPHSAISGTYYVQIPTGSGPLKFEDPRLGFFMARPTIHPKAPQRFQ
ncbi:MAG: TIGR02466 family protein, partial [Bdellovibrionaceae bacterium]|nr:TIGR02466 family protein [Pseudobdellovibrionaceae bacterium]